MFLIVLPDLAVEESLLTRIQRGEQQAISDTYDLYFAPLYQYVRMKTGDGSLAEDIVSEVFISLIESLNRPSAPRKNLRAWLFTVARNQIATHYGKQKQLPLSDLEDWMPTSPDNNPEILAGDVIELERVRHALRMLVAEHQEVLLLRFGQRLSIKETADIMGKSASAIKSLQWRALDTLRSILIEPRTEAS